MTNSNRLLNKFIYFRNLKATYPFYFYELWKRATMYTALWEDFSIQLMTKVSNSLYNQIIDLAHIVLKILLTFVLNTHVQGNEVTVAKD